MLKNIIAGVKAYGNSLSLIYKLKLWSFFIIPMLISFFVAVFVIFMAYSFSDNISYYITNLWKWDFGKEAFGVFSTFLSAVSIVVIGLILYKHIVMALASPFMSPVSEKIELHLVGKKNTHRQTSFKEQLIRGVRLSIRNLGRELLFTIPILLISFIPVIGLLSTILLFLMQSYYAGFGNIDYTLERHYTYNESINFVKKNKGIAIGNGIVFMLFLLIPVIGIILVLPLSVTAATTQTIKKLN